MGAIEISDGNSSRRIPTTGLTGSIRLELVAAGPRVIVPEGVGVTRLRSAD